MDSALKETKQIKVCMPPESYNCPKEPFTINITPSTKFVETMKDVLKEYTHTICCIPYIKLGDDKISVVVDFDCFSVNFPNFIDETTFRECVIGGKNVYENITELGAYWT